MTNLVAYIPVLNRQYLDWLRGYQPFRLYLISQETAGSLIPRLERNLGAVSALEIAPMITSVVGGEVYILNPPKIPPQTKFIMPDEDICHLVAQKYFYPVSFCKEVIFEKIWARWDMSAIEAKQPVIADVEVSRDLADHFRMQIARDLQKESPDWFRQIGAVVFRGEKQIACTFNTHLPSEYEACIFGDPAINRDAGQKTKISLALHAEQAVIALCARKGVALEGTSLYVTTFPCPDCARVIAKAGIKRVFFEDGYSILDAQRILVSENIQIVHLKSPESA